LLDPADTLGVPARGEALHDFDQALDAFRLHVLRHLVGHRGSLGAGARAEDEGERSVVAHLFDHLDRFGEVLLGLAREPDDEVGGEREVGDHGAQLVDERHVTLPTVRAPHRLQDPRRPGLERKVNVLADRIALRHRDDHGISEVLRMRAREANPVDAVHPVQRAKELAELRREIGGEVAAPGVHILAQERHLADAGAGERGDLRDDVAGPSALLPAAHRGDNAVGALRVAAHRDLHPRLIASLPPGRQVGCELPPLREPSPGNAFAARTDPVREVRNRAWAEGHVHFGVQLEDALALRLRVAAADRDHLLRVARLKGPRLGEVGGEPLVGLLAHGARVEDDHVGGVLRPRLPEPEGLEHALDPLRIVRVHLAPERRDEVALHPVTVPL